MNLADLTIRQQLIVAWTGMGITRKQMAGMLGITDHGVHYMFTKLSRTMNVSVAHLTHYALLTGLIEPGQLSNEHGL